MASISQVTSLRTNINSFGGQTVSLDGVNSFKGVERKVSSASLGGFGDNSIDKFYKDLSELAQYKSSKLAITSVGIIREYIVKFESNAENILTISDNGIEIPESEMLNKLLKSINFIKSLNDNLFDYIYFGSHLFLIKVPKNEELINSTLVQLNYPFSSIVHSKDSSYDYYVNGQLLDLDYDTYFYIPLRLGSLDLVLDRYNLPGYANDDTLINTDSWLASKPLFYGMLIEFKLFILKDILTKLIQLQDIVAPNLLLTNVDKNTSEESAIELAQKIENLINQYGDLTKLISSNADITTLSQFILNNVRVYPDLLGSIRNTEKFDFSRLIGRNQEVQNQLDTDEEGLVNAIGIPIDLYKGRATNKYDALRQSDRLMTRVESEMVTIDDSLIEFVINYLKSIGRYKSTYSIKCNLFDYSFLRGINSSYKYDISTQYIRNLTELTGLIKSSVEQSSSIFDTDKLVKYVTDSCELIYPGFKDLLKDNYLAELKKSLESAESTEPTYE